MAESSTITREMIEAGAACRPHADILSLSRVCPGKQVTTRIQQLADLPRCMRDNIRARDIFGVLVQKALCRFCNPAFDLIHQGEPAGSLATQVSVRKHQIRRARKQKSDPVCLLCCGGRQCISAPIGVRHLFKTYIQSAYHHVADAAFRTTVQNAYLRRKLGTAKKYAQTFSAGTQLLGLKVPLSSEPAALATGGARGLSYLHRS
jgi:hypothetical protein